MEIKTGSIIKIICSNGVVEAGKLIEHTREQMVIEVFDKSLFIIQDPYKNVVAIKITTNETKLSKPEEVFIDEEPIPDQYYPKEELRLKNLAELHLLKANEERKRAQELLKANKIIKHDTNKFGFPDFTKPIPKQIPKIKT
jgi:hypothetical protein